MVDVEETRNVRKFNRGKILAAWPGFGVAFMLRGG